MSGDLLAAMVASARRSAEARARDAGPGVEHAALSAGPTRPFGVSLMVPGTRIIAECKRRSPSRGILRAEYDPAAIARGYEASGAAAISVLTEPAFFDGSIEHLRSVAAAVRIPVLRKDFIVTEFQVLEARAAGADAILLIVAAMDDRTLTTLLHAAAAVDLAALVEVHDAHELERAIAAGARIVGVNSRNLRTLEVRRATLDELAAAIPPHAIAVAESGLQTAGDLTTLRARGYRAFLIGERFMTSPDPAAALAALRTAADAADAAAEGAS